MIFVLLPLTYFELLRCYGSLAETSAKSHAKVCSGPTDPLEDSMWVSQFAREKLHTCVQRCCTSSGQIG